MTRKHITFRGSVQGVGFRRRARRATALFYCTGWCRNEKDGSVTMELQGEKEHIDLVLLAIEAGKFVSIESMEVKTIPVDKTESGFVTE